MDLYLGRSRYIQIQEDPGAKVRRQRGELRGNEVKRAGRLTVGGRRADRLTGPFVWGRLLPRECMPWRGGTGWD